MSLQSWQEALQVQGVAGTAFNTFTTAKTIIPSTSLLTLPAGFWNIGRALRVRAIGSLSNIVTTPGTLTFQVMFGSVIAFTTGAMQMSSTAHTTVPFWLEVMLTCRSVGSGTSGTVIGQSLMQSQAIVATAVADSTATHQQLLAPNTAPAVGTGFDSTAAMVVDFFGAFSISNAANQVQIQQYFVESLN